VWYNVGMIPAFVKPFLWSYDTNSLDLERDKRRIITNVLKLGTKEASDWLFDTYSKEDIIECVSNPLPGEWDRKSLSYWALVLDVTPLETKRLIPA